MSFVVHQPLIRNYPPPVMVPLFAATSLPPAAHTLIQTREFAVFLLHHLHIRSRVEWSRVERKSFQFAARPTRVVPLCKLRTCRSRPRALAYRRYLLTSTDTPTLAFDILPRFAIRYTKRTITLNALSRSTSSYAFVEFRSTRDAEDAYYDMYAALHPIFSLNLS